MCVNCHRYEGSNGWEGAFVDLGQTADSVIEVDNRGDDTGQTTRGVQTYIHVIGFGLKPARLFFHSNAILAVMVRPTPGTGDDSKNACLVAMPHNGYQVYW